MGFATDAMFTGGSRDQDRWRTPPALFAECSRRWGPFAVDAAAEQGANLAPNWFGPDHSHLVCRDAIARPSWGGPCWVNPPYSLCAEFLEGCVRNANAGHVTVALVFARTDTAWWWRWVLGRKTTPGGLAVGARTTGICAAEIAWIFGRVRFILPDGRELPSKGNSAPAPSVAIVYRPGYREDWPRNSTMVLP